MLHERQQYHVLLASSAEQSISFLRSSLPRAQFHPITAVETAGEAKRLLVQNSFDLVIINTPLKDEAGVQLALETAERTSAAVIILVAPEIYEQIAYKVECAGVLALPKPVTAPRLLSGTRIMLASAARLREAEKMNARLRAKLDEVKLLSNVKLHLIINEKMSESEAHHYIEQYAMNERITKKEAAQRILDRYTN